MPRGIVEHGPGLDRAGAAVDLVIEEIQQSGVGEALLVVQTDLHGNVQLLDAMEDRLPVRPPIEAQVLQQHRLFYVEIDVDRIGGHDGG